MAERAFVNAGAESERELDALMADFVETGKAGAVAGAVPGARVEGANGKTWDRWTLLTGGFVPVGSIFFARPPKTRSQQKILMALSEAQKAMQPYFAQEGTDEETASRQDGFMEALLHQSSILVGLAQELFFVYETDLSPTEVRDSLMEGKLALTKADFRGATEEEIVCDETGLTPEEISEAVNALLALSRDPAGN